MSSKKPLSPARIAANRANALHSTGPRTAEGKARSSQNATTHGLTGDIPLADTLLLSPSDLLLHQSILAAVLDQHDPATNLELHLCHQIADSMLRLRRVRPTEDAMFAISPPATAPLTEADTFATESSEPPSAHPRDISLHRGKVMLHHSSAFANLSVYEQRLQRSLKATLDQLEKLQTTRLALERSQMSHAINHYKERRMRNLPFNPASDGFVFSTDEIEFAIHLDHRKKQVAAAADCRFNLVEYQKQYPPKELKDAPKAA